VKKILFLVLSGLLIASPAMAQFNSNNKIQGKSGGTATVTNDRLDVNVQGASASGVEVIQDTAADLNATVTQTSGVNFDVEGAVAEGAANTSNPITIGGQAESTIPTAIDDGDVGALFMDLYRRLVIAGYDNATGSMMVTPVTQEPIGSGSVVCIDTTLDADPTSDTCTVFIGDKRKVTILLNAVMDWTDSDPDLDLDLDFAVSADNSTFYALENIIDKTGEDSPITSTISLALSGADTDTTHLEQYYLPVGFTAQYLRVTLTATNSDADDTVVADVLVQYQK